MSQNLKPLRNNNLNNKRPQMSQRNSTGYSATLNTTQVSNAIGGNWSPNGMIIKR